MPRQNRVTPFGELVATPARGTLMGNRGCLHDARGSVVRSWQLRRWICCLLQFRGRRRAVMTPGHYTELFFLDEATAIAAGHRPCAECRRERFDAYRRALAGGRRQLPRASEIDARLHTQRLTPAGSQRLHAEELDTLPDGVFVLLPDREAAYLVRGDALLAWSAAGYTARVERPHGIVVAVLTPRLSVRAIRGGYVPDVHPSADDRMERDAGGQSSGGSPPARVAAALQAGGETESPTNRTPPSQWSTFTPPAWRLRAARRPFCCVAFRQSGPGGFGGSAWLYSVFP